MTYAELTSEPLGAWPWPETASLERTYSRFKAAWSTTNWELRRELAMLGVAQGVLEVDVADPLRGIGKRDRVVLEDAKVKSPRVALRFAHPYQGPLVYHCDQYLDWKDNVRGIRLGLEALRAVDRYGITSSHEQFAGFKALPSTTGPTMTATRAAELLRTEENDTRSILGDAEVAKRAVRWAVKHAHPDVGGSAERFQQVQTARKVLAAHHGREL